MFETFNKAFWSCQQSVIKIMNIRNAYRYYLNEASEKVYKELFIKNEVIIFVRRNDTQMIGTLANTSFTYFAYSPCTFINMHCKAQLKPLHMQSVISH